MRETLRWTGAPTLALFTSLSTLLCCALPATLIMLGMGATMAGLVSAAPWLVTLSEHKAWLFGGAAVLLLAAGYMRWASRNAPCPADPAMARACARLRLAGGVIYWIAVAAFAFGAFMAFVAPRLFF